MGSILFTLVMATAPASPPPVAGPPVKPALQVCQAWGPKPPECIEPPVRETVRIYNGWRAADGSHPADVVMIRRPGITGRYDEPLAKAGFPDFLRKGDGTTLAQVSLNLIIAFDGSIVSCRAAKVEAWSHTAAGKRDSLESDPALGEQACSLVRTNRRFKPAIDASGKPIEAPAVVDVDYSRERYAMLAPPAPPPPSRWLGREPYDRGKTWPPHHYLSESVSFISPKFKDFLSDKAGLPKEALVGVLMDFAPDGRALKCAIGLPSTDKRLDEATCAGLMTTRNTPNRWQVRSLPIEVSWKRDKASARAAGPLVMPSLAAPLPLPADMLPVADPPKWGITIRLALDPQGKPQSCLVVRPSYVDALDAASCRVAMQQAQFTPGKDGFGRPVASGMDLRADWAKGAITFSGY